MLEPDPRVRGPLPRLVRLLAAALREHDCEVRLERWGQHHDDETMWHKVRGRASDLATIRAELKRRSYDVLYVTTAHDWKTMGRDIPLLLTTRKGGRRSVLHIHGTFTHWLTRDAPITARIATRLLLRLCDAILVSSRHERESLAAFYPDGRFFVVDNIYAPETSGRPEPVPAEWHLPTDAPVVFFAGRLIPEKGVLDLLDAWPRVRERAASHLLLAGVGPLEDTVRKRLTESPFAGEATWIRYVARPHLEAAYRRTTIFVLPSYHTEGFPAVIQDAIAHGLPIVTTAIRGVADHLTDGVHARFVPARDPTRLAEVIADLLIDQQQRERMAAANLAKARDFEANVVVNQYLTVLDHLRAETT